MKLYRFIYTLCIFVTASSVFADSRNFRDQLSDNIAPYPQASIKYRSWAEQIYRESVLEIRAALAAEFGYESELEQDPHQIESGVDGLLIWGLPVIFVRDSSKESLEYTPIVLYSELQGPIMGYHLEAWQVHKESLHNYFLRFPEIMSDFESNILQDTNFYFDGDPNQAAYKNLSLEQKDIDKLLEESMAEHYQEIEHRRRLRLKFEKPWTHDLETVLSQAIEGNFTPAPQHEIPSVNCNDLLLTLTETPPQ